MTTCLPSVVGTPRTGAPAHESLHLLPLPVIRRQGIRWWGGVGTPLEIELEFENPGPLPSAPAEARVEVAPFGAFLSWKPFVRVAVPSIPAGGSVRVADTVSGGAALPSPFASLLSSMAALLQTFTVSSGDKHFVGNLNVFVTGGKPVERHLQRAVGLERGKENMALFCVGDGRPDAYTFSLGEAEPGWEVKLAGVRWDRPRKILSELLPLSITPPPHAETGKVSILVTRASAGRTVPVEFELEAGSRASKCYHF